MITFYGDRENRIRRPKPRGTTQLRNMLQLILTGLPLFVSTFVLIMVWPIFSRSRWNPSGRVRVFSRRASVADKAILALLHHWGLKWPWPLSGHYPYEERCRRVHRRTE